MHSILSKYQASGLSLPGILSGNWNDNFVANLNDCIFQLIQSLNFPDQLPDVFFGFVMLGRDAPEGIARLNIDGNHVPLRRNIAFHRGKAAAE